MRSTARRSGETSREWYKMIEQVALMLYIFMAFGMLASELMEKRDELEAESARLRAALDKETQ